MALGSALPPPPRIGDRYRVKVDQNFSSGGIGYFQEFDVGTICGHADVHLCIAWDRTERVTECTLDELLDKCTPLGERIDMVIEVGDRVRARPGQSLQDSEGSSTFKEHDLGIVASISHESVHVVWDRTERVSSCGRADWSRQFKRIPHFGKARTSLEVGERVWALSGSTLSHAGKEVFRGHDTGTVASVTSASIAVSWDRTRLCSPHPAGTWMCLFKLLPYRKARTVLEVGDRVEALSGQELFESGVEIYREFYQGVVVRLGEGKVWVDWDETGKVSPHHPQAWLQQLRLTSSEDVGGDLRRLGESALPVLYAKVRARPGREYTDESTSVHYYAEGDKGVISAIGDNGRVSFTWDRTNQVSTSAPSKWLDAVEVLPYRSGHAPLRKQQVGARVQALKGAGFTDPGTSIRYYNGGDIGVLSGVGNELVYVTWDYTGCVSRHSAMEWLAVFRVLQDVPPVSLPRAGDQVRSLTGRKLTGCMTRGCELGKVEAVDDSHIHVTWQSGLSAVVPISTWLQHMKPSDL